MARRPFNPLDLIPSPDAIRAKLVETRTLADRLQILLEVSERITRTAASNPLPAPTPTDGNGGPRA